MRSRRATIIGSIAFALSLLWTTPAFADTAPLFGPTWKNNTTLGTTTRPAAWFTTGVPTGERPSRIRDGFTQWNGVGEPLQYQFAGSDYGTYDPFSSCGPTSNAVFIHWTSIDGGGGTLGRSSYCSISSGTVTSRYTAWIQFDSSEEWCTGTGDCFDGVFGIGANVDLWSVATHESGHVSALGHFSASSSVCARQRGPGHDVPASHKPGTERQRTLSPSDSGSLRHYY